MDDVAQELLGEGEFVFLGVGEGGVDRDADVARVVDGGVAFEGDHIGRCRVVQEIGVQAGEGGVGQEGDG